MLAKRHGFDKLFIRKINKTKFPSVQKRIILVECALSMWHYID